MSKLSFKEDSYYDGVGESGGEDNHIDLTADSDAEITDSYSLYGIDPTNKRTKSITPSKMNVAFSASSEVETVSSHNSDEVDNGTDEPKSSKKKRKKRKLSASKHEDVEAEISVQKPSSQSAFILQFLSRKREASQVPEPPEIEPANNSFLREFNDSIKSNKKNKKLTIPDASDSEEEDDVPVFSRGNNINLSGVHRTESNTSLDVSTDADREPAVEETGPIDAALQFFNLPYRITTEQLQAFGEKHGYKITSVVMGVDWKTKLPSGSATVHVELERMARSSATDPIDLDEPNLYGDPEHDEVTECIAAFQGEEVGGRPLRVQRFVAKKRQSGSLGGRGDSRYFSGDISCKCHSCGQVGHRQQDCTNESVASPCHLCAGQDHDAGSCPNITCYRCGKFGHHSRDCTGASMAKPVICTNCGSTTHDVRTCRNNVSGAGAAGDSKVAGSQVRCMSCNKFGHVMCQPLPPVPAATAGEVYCPNCGESGHHVDYPLLCSLSLLNGSSSTSTSTSTSTGESARKKSRSKTPAGKLLCMEPKYEAFTKYPNMIREIDSIPDSERLGYFRDITRRGQYSDQQLFPPLARQIAQIQSSAQNNNSNNNRSSAPSGRHSFGGGSSGGGGSGGGDSGRSISLQYSSDKPQPPPARSQSVGPRVQQQQNWARVSALESVTGKRKSLEPELASRYSALHPYSGGGDDDRGGHSSHRDRVVNFEHQRNVDHDGGNRANRRNMQFNTPTGNHMHFTSTPESKRSSSGGGGGGYGSGGFDRGSGSKHRPPPPPPPPPLSVPSAPSSAWKEKIESRKRRFHE